MNATVKSIKNIHVNKVAAAIEADAGHALPGLRESLEQVKRGEVAAIHTPEQIAMRKRGRPAGSVQEHKKEAVKLRLDTDLLEALRATGDGWQTRINQALRTSMQLSGKL